MRDPSNVNDQRLEFVTLLLFSDEVIRLSYQRISINILNSLEQDIPLKQRVIFLNLSGSKIGDKGACMVAKACFHPFYIDGLHIYPYLLI